MPANTWPVILELIFPLSSRRLLQWKASMNTGELQGAISKVLHHFPEIAKTTQWQRTHRLRMTTPIEDCAILLIMRELGFSQHPQSRWDPVGQTGRHFSVRRVVAARYRRSTRCSRLIVWPSDYCIQARRDQNWNRQHWSRVIFVDEFRFGHYLCDGRKRVSGRLANCCIEQTDRLCSPSFVAWGTFHFHVTGTSDLVVVDDQVNQKCYNNILDQNVFPRGLGIFSKKLCACASQRHPPHTMEHIHVFWKGKRLRSFGGLSRAPGMSRDQMRP